MRRKRIRRVALAVLGTSAALAPNDGTPGWGKRVPPTERYAENSRAWLTDGTE